MAFGEELLKALSATQYRASDSPYAIGSQAINAVTPNLVNPYGSTGSNLAITAGSGMLAALLAGLAENDAQSRNAEFAPSISAFMKADPTQQAQLAAKEPRLSSLYNAMLANSFTNDMELKQEKAKYETLSPLRVKEEVDKQIALQPINLEKAFRDQVAQLKAAEGVAITPDNQFIQVTDPLQREVTLDAEKLKNELLAKSGKTRTGTAGAVEQISDPNTDIESEANKTLKDLQSRFNATEAAKQYTQVRPAVEAMVKALKDNNVVTDQELSRYSILLIEPGMAVREGEQAAIMNSQSIPQAWKGQIEKASQGTTALQPEVRKGLENLAKRAYEGRLKNYSEALNFFKNEAKIMKVSPDRIAYLGEGIPVEQVFGGSSEQSAAMEELKRRGLIP